MAKWEPHLIMNACGIFGCRTIWQGDPPQEHDVHYPQPSDLSQCRIFQNGEWVLFGTYSHWKQERMSYKKGQRVLKQLQARQKNSKVLLPILPTEDYDKGKDPEYIRELAELKRKYGY